MSLLVHFGQPGSSHPGLQPWFLVSRGTSLTSATLTSAPALSTSQALDRRASTREWTRQQIRVLLLADFTAIVAAVTLALGLRFGLGADPTVGPLSYTLVTALAIPVWMGALAI